MPKRWMAFSNRLRMTYSFRSKASPSAILEPRPMKAWNMSGSAARAGLAPEAVLGGTGRQPRRGGLGPLEVHDEAGAPGIRLVAGVLQPLCGGRFVSAHRLSSWSQFT